MAIPSQVKHKSTAASQQQLGLASAALLSSICCTGQLPSSWPQAWPSLGFLSIGNAGLQSTLPPSWGAEGAWPSLVRNCLSLPVFEPLGSLLQLYKLLSASQAAAVTGMLQMRAQRPTCALELLPLQLFQADS